ncbi:Transcription factor RFX3, partial [Fragariocoptes setiger]
MISCAYDIENSQGMQTQPQSIQATDYSNQEHNIDNSAYVTTNSQHPTADHNDQQQQSYQQQNDCITEGTVEQSLSNSMNEAVPVGLGHVVQWLLDNYQVSEGDSLPRSTLYTHYQDFCEQIAVNPVNPASFGKVIRSVFSGLKTRRLGTRGNSKYHYFGIKIRNDSPLANPQDWAHETGSESDDCRSNDHCGSQRKRVHLRSTNGSRDNINDPSRKHEEQAKQLELSDLELRAYLDSNVSVAGYWLPMNETFLMELSNVVSVDTIQMFEAKYRELYDSIFQCLYDLKFDHVEDLLCQFWEGSHETRAMSDNQVPGLNFETLHLMTSSSDAFIDWIVVVDYSMYSAIGKLLMPDILAPIPRILAQQIRIFAKNISGWMRKAVSQYHNRLCDLKNVSATAFGYTLRRHTSLNHLASAANAIWQNESQIQQMYLDLTRVDMKDVQHQAALISQCNSYTVEEIMQGFKIARQQRKTSAQILLEADS